MKTPEEICKELVDGFIIESSMKILQDSGHINPTSFLVIDEQRVAMFPIPGFGNDEEKLKSIGIFHMAIEHTKAKGVILVVDGWYTAYKEMPKGKDFIRPSEDPKRKEALIITMKTEKEHRLFMVKYQRKGSNIMFEPIEESEQKGHDIWLDDCFKTTH